MWLVWLVMVVGWVINIFQIFGFNFDDPVTVEIILRIVGIPVFFIGSFMGIFVW